MRESARRAEGRVSINILAVLLGVALGAGAWYWCAQPPIEKAAEQIVASAPATQADASATASGASAQKPAVAVATPTLAPLLAAARAGSRVVAVGDYGTVLLSDDEGRTYRQAKSVPSQALLTSVCFVDDRLGWIAGHDGVVLHTEDGGETWALQREDLKGDRPLFAIQFRDAQHGLAVGLFGTAVVTDDGGKTWNPLAIEIGEENDHHLYAIFGDFASELYVASEQGRLYRSSDGGAHWILIQTRNPGTFWAGARLANGAVLAVGQHGHVFRSENRGDSWFEVTSGTSDSLTAIVQKADGTVLVVGLAGTMLESRDGGRTFTASSRPDRVPLTAALAGTDGKALLFGGNGVVADTEK